MRGRVLVIAGSDSGGGAGIQADLKTVMALGGYATTAITAVTAQNTRGVYGIHAVPPGFVCDQIACVLDDIGADAIKIGMLGDAALIAAVADVLASRAAGVPLVLDPVMVAKGGASLLPPPAVAALIELLLPMAALLTPNLPEAAALTGHPIAHAADMPAAARALQAMGPAAVLLKGGHLPGDDLLDVLVEGDDLTEFPSRRIPSCHTHGTGCTLASAVATGIAQRMPLAAAVARARAYVRDAIAAAPGLGHGHSPLDHLAGITPR
jgi:hydroxymethylpyrimidine/phosphomethylpyrimidine kinase